MCKKALLWCRALGDVISQKIEGRKNVDLKRSLLTAGYGGLFIGERMPYAKQQSTSLFASCTAHLVDQ